MLDVRNHVVNLDKVPTLGDFESCEKQTLFEYVHVC